MPAHNKPKLEKLSTPLTANFPSEITSASVATPVSALALPIKSDPNFIKTPISPPIAYTDFLSKAMSLNSPLPGSGETTPDSLPATATSAPSECSSKSDEPSPTSSASPKRSTPPATAPIIPPSPFKDSAPLSATLMKGPLTGPITFPSLRLPPSPAVSNIDSPASARSPFSARSHTAFDWDAALKARVAEQKRVKSKTSVRHIREVVTRTVTYTPKMEPAPRGKRRKVE